MSIWDLKKVLTLENETYKNTHNYILKLRAAVGMNLDYFTPDDTVTVQGMAEREQDRINLIIQTKELENDSKNFLSSVVKTKNFEQKQIEKKINRQYKYSRSRFFNIDFMEFLQIIIVHCVIVN